MTVKEEVEVALKDVLLPELTEIKKRLADLKASLDAVMEGVKSVGRSKDDFDHLEDLQAAGLPREQAEALIRAKYKMNQAAKADLNDVGLQVEGYLKDAGFNPKLAQTIVNYMKDRLAA
jgi:hypothetical protein